MPSSRIVGIFPIGELGEEFGVAEWVPDPEVIEQELLKLANDFEDWSAPLAKARAAFIYSTELHFETQSDPYGKPWVALDPDYLARKIKEGYPETILERTGDLQRAATNPEAWLVTEREIMFDSASVPFYGGYHQKGTASADVARVLDKLRRGQGITREEAAIVSSEGRGQNLPQRMFIGADEETILEIEEAFVEYLESLVVTDIPLFGGKGFAVRGPGGRFVRSGFGRV